MTDKDEGHDDRRYSLISHAAGLMLKCAGFISDQQAVKEGWTVYYAVDVDVIKLYLSPEQKPHYATVFGRVEDADTRLLLARLLADFILKDLKSSASPGVSGNGKLFIIKPHDEELGKIIFSLSAEVANALDDSKRVTSVLDELSHRLAGTSPSELSQWLIDNAPDLVALFDAKSGPRSEIARFEMLDESRLTNLERYREEDGHRWSFPLPRLTGRAEDLQGFTKIFNDWKLRLSKHKAPVQALHAVVRDAYVMATIEWVNSRLSVEKRKLVLVTGTGGILRAALKYKLSEIDGRPETFADRYVRHPQAFMAAPSFFSPPSANPEDSASFKLFDWLNLFFPRVFNEGSTPVAVVNTGLLRSIERGAGRDFEEAVNLLTTSAPAGERQLQFPGSMLDEWQIQVRTASIARAIQHDKSSWSLRASAFLEWLREQLDQGLTLEQLQLDLSIRALHSLNGLYSSTVWLGLWSKVGVLRDRVRGIPTLRFDSPYRRAQEYCQLVVDAMRAGEGSHGDRVPVNLSKMYARLSEVDESHYHSHLIHALAYATKGHWYATRTLGRLALGTADGIPEDEKRDRKGREAAYLLAISSRRLARRTDDLFESERYLREAEARETPGAPRDSRFVSEAIAIKVARINFQFFLRDDASTAISDLELVLLQASDLLERLPLDPLKQAQKWVRQQLLTNVLNLALIARCAKAELPNPILEKIRNCFPILFELRQERTHGGSNWDDVAEFIYLVAVTVFSSNVVDRSEANATLRDLYFPGSLPFDKVREARFRELAERSRSGAPH